jgi:hypothetical protein
MNENYSASTHTRAYNKAHPPQTFQQQLGTHLYQAAPAAADAAVSYLNPAAGHAVQAARQGAPSISNILYLLGTVSHPYFLAASQLAATIPAAYQGLSWYDERTQAWARTQTPEVQSKLAAVARQLNVTPAQQQAMLGVSHPLGFSTPFNGAIHGTVQGIQGFSQRFR